MNHKSAVLIFSVLGFLALALGWWRIEARLAANAAANALPVLAIVPDFSFTEAGGHSVDLDDLKGKTWIADFIFTSCAGPCPLLSREMAALADRVAAVPSIRLVSFSVDPERDTPERLLHYAERFRQDPERWWFLRAETREAITEFVQKGFLLALGVTEDDAREIIHSTRFVLVDQVGRIRGYYDSQIDGFERKILTDVKALQTESGS